MKNKKDIRIMTLTERYKYINEQKRKRFNSTNNKEEFDEDHDLDMVMNDMVKDMDIQDFEEITLQEKLDKTSESGSEEFIKNLNK